MQSDSARHDVGPLIICPTRPLDFYSVGDLRKEIKKGLEGEARGLIVSLEDTPFMDSSGLGVLVGGWKLARDLDVPFHIVCPQEHLQKSFRITGLVKVICLHPSVPDALLAAVSSDLACVGVR
jgi:anti-sigma B factor antagonist